MEGTAVAVCEILRYLIIHWKCETAGVSKGSLLEGQLVISMEALSSKHQANTLHCVTTIISAGSICGGLVLKKFLKEIQFILRVFSAKLTWTSEEASCSQDTSRVTPFQIIFEVDEKPGTLMTDCLVIKNFLHKIIIVHPKIRLNFTVKVNGVLSMEICGVANEPILSLSNGIALVVNYQHYMSRPKFGTTELLCSRIHPVLGHPVTLFIPDDVAGMGLLGELMMTPVAALCPCPNVSSTELNRISSVSIFLYGPSGLPLILPRQEQPPTIFKDTSYFIDWKKYHLYMVPNLDFNLDKDLVLPDMSYLVKSSEQDQSQKMDPQGQTLLLFLFVDFHNRFPVQRMELRGVHTLLTTHLNTILMDSHRVVKDSVQIAVDQALEQHHQATKAHRKLQASLSVAMNSIMSIVTGSTSSSFRQMCLQALQASDTREFKTKLHRAFHEIIQQRFLHHCSCKPKQHLPPEKNEEARNTEDTYEDCSLELLPETSGQAASRRLKRKSLRHDLEEMRASPPARAISQSQAATRGPESSAASLAPREGPRAEHRRVPGPSRTNPGRSLEDMLWLQEVSNLSEWLSPSPRP